jgi:hypothetical protein
VSGDEIGHTGPQLPQMDGQMVRHCETGIVATPPARSRRVSGVSPSNVSELKDSFLTFFLTAISFFSPPVGRSAHRRTTSGRGAG